jgi:hypothetical protein
MWLTLTRGGAFQPSAAWVCYGTFVQAPHATP